MLDVFGTVVLVLVCALFAGALIGLPRASVGTKFWLFAGALSWVVLMLAIAARGGFAPGAIGAVPAVLIPFALLLLLLVGVWSFSGQIRKALLGVPLWILVGLNVTRVVGVFFLLLNVGGRLAAPFAPSAGFGDIVVGVLALPLMLALRRGEDRVAGWLARWNMLGTLDLVVAISLGVLSATGTPFQVFTADPGTVAMTRVPWILIPSTIVPVCLLIHVMVAQRVGLPWKGARVTPSR